MAEMALALVWQLVVAVLLLMAEMLVTGSVGMDFHLQLQELPFLEVVAVVAEGLPTMVVTVVAEMVVLLVVRAITGNTEQLILEAEAEVLAQQAHGDTMAVLVWLFSGLQLLLTQELHQVPRQ
jgi:hypothetical protein